MLERSALLVLALTLAAAGQTSTPKTTKTGAQKTGTTASTTKQTTGTPAAEGNAQHPTAIIHTTAGDLKCELFPDKAPKTVANFIGLSTGQKDWTDPQTNKPVHGRPLYDGTIFHRVIPGFMIQGGDPLGQGVGGPGYKFEDELSPDLLFDRPGRLAMANSGPNTNGSQFFITEVPTPFLNPCLDEGGCMGGRRQKGTGYSLFGQCDDNSVELVKKIARMPCQGGQQCNGNNSFPANPVRIEHIDIIGVPPAKKAAAPAARKKAGAAKKKTTAPPQ